MRTMLKQELTSREQARLLSLLGIADYELGELEQAAATIHAEIDAATEGGLETFLVNAHGNLAEVLMQLGDHRAAAHQQLRCAELLPADGNVVQHGFTLVMAAQLAAGGERWRDAVTLQSVADRLLESSGYEMYEQDRRRRCRARRARREYPSVISWWRRRRRTGQVAIRRSTPPSRPTYCSASPSTARSPNHWRHVCSINPRRHDDQHPR